MFRSSSSTPASTFEAMRDTMRPYMDRAVHDEKVRDNVHRAWKAARKVYGELNGDGPMGAASKLSRKDSVREDLDTTVQSLSEAIVRMSGKQPRRRGSWAFLLLLVGLGVALFNPATGPGTRKWVKDLLFGSEEEFDYATPNY